MSKLGKKARKFAKKHLPSVMKKRRKQKAMFKKKPRGEKKDGPTHKTLPRKHLDVDDYEDDVAVGDVSLVPVFDGYETDDSIEEGSDSDEFLPETFEGAYDAAGESDDESDEGNDRPLQAQNKELRLELAKQKKKLDRLIEKDPEFAEFLEARANELEQDSDYSDTDEEAETSDQDMVEVDSSIGKPLTTAIIDSWCRLILEEKNLSVLPNLLNAYRAACQYGSGDAIDAFSQRIQSSKTFVKIVNFTLREADNIFRTHLEIPIPDCEKHTVLGLKKTQKWKDSEPLIQSYLSSTIIFLNHVTDSEILAFTLTRLRASTIFFAAFPSLLKKLIKVTVHLWATGEGKVPSASFLIMRDAATQLSLNCLESCLIKTYKAFIARSKFLEPTNLLHIKFLADSLVELYSLDVPRSCSKALVSIQQLATILRQCLHTKEKETMEKIYSWQYINCVDLWVKYVCANVEDNDLQLLVYLIVQIINGVLHLFSGPRHLPLRVKCIQMLNQLSSSSRDFIPVTSLVLDSLEYIGTGKEDAKSAKPFDMSFALKVPKQWLKSRLFQEECVLSVIELLSAHFAQWSYHISFPELAAIPLIRLRKFNEKTTVESLRRPVKRLIDMVEQNVEFVNKKREEVAFSPKDKAAVASFLQEIKVDSKQTPFTQYYTDIIKRSLSRSSVMQSKAAQKKSKKGKANVPKKGTHKENAEKSLDSTQSGRTDGRKRKKGSDESSESTPKKPAAEEKLTTVHHDNTTAEDNATDVSKQVKVSPVVQKSNGRRDVRKAKKMKT
ncbi:hypothetical protein C5167_041242 [Papaver somniferum]|uniref:Nucleolar complex protein 2 homolog n=1 Tax=Papaver somniferum TaxID=3469 RepID=A0A4Y7IKP6_PAPSO|nr:nucleolar complex protein 2 homolog [Papaver somniferum]RZC48301.1 hypothetical protein C5167_041242 [Papaver somniferum]